MTKYLRDQYEQGKIYLSTWLPGCQSNAGSITFRCLWLASVYLWLPRFQYVAGSIAFRFVVEQKLLAKGSGGSNLLTSCQPVCKNEGANDKPHPSEIQPTPVVTDFKRFSSCDAPFGQWADPLLRSSSSSSNQLLATLGIKASIHEPWGHLSLNHNSLKLLVCDVPHREPQISAHLLSFICCERRVFWIILSL